MKKYIAIDTKWNTLIGGNSVLLAFAFTRQFGHDPYLILPLKEWGKGNKEKKRGIQTAKACWKSVSRIGD